MRERSNRPNRPYAAIPNAALRDASISIEARGLLALLMTYSDDWEFKRDHLMEITGMGKDRFGKVMGELVSRGYVSVVSIRNELGHLLGKTWVIRDDATDVREMPTSVDAPMSEKSATDVRENRRPVKPTSGKSAPIRRTTDKKTNLEEDLFGSDEPQKPAFEKIEDRFDEFWSAYPKKAGKPAAQKAWAKAAKKTDPERIIAAAKVYAGTDGVARGFVKFPQGWLNEERFNDPDLQPPPPRSQKFVYHPGGVVT